MSYSLQHPYSSLTEAVLRPFKADVFIETGTNVGRAVTLALAVGFTRVHSVEEDPAIFAVAKDTFKADSRVHLELGDSPSFLRRVLPLVQSHETATIYLDAHSVERNPLLEELDVINEFPKRFTVLIDDVRMFGTPDWHGLKLSAALTKLNGYVISYANTNHAPGDLLVAIPEIVCG